MNSSAAVASVAPIQPKRLKDVANRLSNQNDELHKLLTELEGFADELGAVMAPPPNAPIQPNIPSSSTTAGHLETTSDRLALALNRVNELCHRFASL